MQHNKNSAAGYSLAVIASVAFSAKSILAKLVFGYGVDPETLLALRFLLTAPLFWIALYFFPGPRVGAKDMIILALSGFLGLFCAAMANFYGLLYIDASLERIILYVYPSIVAILTLIFFKEKAGARFWASIAIIYAGLAITLKLHEGVGRSELLGAGLVFISAVIFAVSYLITESIGRRVSSVRISAYTTTTATFAFVGAWGFEGAPIPASYGVWWLILIMAVACTFIPVLATAMCIKRIGARRAAVAGMIGPVSTVILAYLILGETIDAIQAIGMTLVMAGVLAISLQKESVTDAGLAERD
ncbi:MAG: DMT family transporter [Deltaproteobacteria bacterium]|nr:DMT family transporter [Deltaproteobacteria bacterium]